MVFDEGQFAWEWRQLQDEPLTEELRLATESSQEAHHPAVPQQSHAEWLSRPCHGQYETQMEEELGNLGFIDAEADRIGLEETLAATSFSSMFPLRSLEPGPSDPSTAERSHPSEALTLPLPTSASSPKPSHVQQRKPKPQADTITRSSRATTAGHTARTPRQSSGLELGGCETMYDPHVSHRDGWTHGMCGRPVRRTRLLPSSLRLCKGHSYTILPLAQLMSHKDPYRRWGSLCESERKQVEKRYEHLLRLGREKRVRLGRAPSDRRGGGGKEDCRSAGEDDESEPHRVKYTLRDPAYLSDPLCEPACPDRSSGTSDAECILLDGQHDARHESSLSLGVRDMKTRALGEEMDSDRGSDEDADVDPIPL